jgi:hypothetical protein
MTEPTLPPPMVPAEVDLRQVERLLHTIFRTARLAPEKADFRPALPMHSLPGLYGADMTERIGAIETKYAGCKFRSRLEARWAVFFDSIGIKWQYEPQGFETGGFKYLPDFRLPGIGWAEVKGEPGALYEDRARMRAMLKGPLLEDVLQVPYPYLKRAGVYFGMLLLGDIPRPGDGLVFHPVLSVTEHEGIVRDMACFAPLIDGGSMLVMTYPQCLLSVMNGLNCAVHLEDDRDKSSTEWSADAVRIQSPRAWSQIESGYTAARQARFEHGASGN